MNRSCQTGFGCYCGISTVRATLAGSKIKSWVRHRKNAERRTKREYATGRTRRPGKPREKLPKAGDAKNGAAGL